MYRIVSLKTNQESCAMRARLIAGVSGRVSRELLLAAIVVGLAGAVSHAAVTPIGDVLPADNPLTDLVNEGLPPAGNFADSSEPADAQTHWEENEDIVVGQRSFGRLDIDGNSQLRYEDLIIGDSGMVGSQTRLGTGFVLITGIDALYNNDPNILPPGLPANFGSASAYARDPNVGFDLYVGRAGQGTLEIRGGGRAEIQDALFVGDQQGSIGTILVDGVASYLGSGGFTMGGGPVGEIHAMIVGHTGIGTMTVSDGGLVVAEAAQAVVANIDTFAAVIGSDPMVTATEEPQPGGQGTVTVTGPTSKWIMGGSLQIGGFHERKTGGSNADIDGAGLEYNSQVGRGTLSVQDGALVSLRPAIGADPDVDLLRVLIGRFGRLYLTGGQISVGNPGTRMDTVQLLNDGLIQGSGRIEAGVFRNRYLGQVRVGAGETLLIDSSSEFMNTMDEQPLANWGVIEVFGTADAPAELEFERAPDAPMNPIEPFRNLRVERPAAAPPADFYGGLITAQHSILRFRSGIENRGMIAFTDGTNYVTGNVSNLGPGPLPTDEEGIINVFGAGVKAIFENDLSNLGTLNIQGGAVVEVLARHSFVTAGDLIINLSPQNSSRIFVGGDAGISGELTVTLSGFAAGSLSAGETFEIISVAGDLGGVDLTDPLHPKPDLTKNPLFTEVEIIPNLAALGLPPDLVMIPVYTPNSVLLSILSTAGLIGADFNGDGIVNAADLAIWRMNVGITMGATKLQGDADGDGDVDGDDFLEIQRRFGMPPGAGSGTGAGLPANVPEPTGLALLLSGGMLALATRRRPMR